MRRLALVAAAVLVAGAVAAAAVILVADDDAQALSKPEYVSRVNGVCRFYNARLATISAPMAIGSPQAVAASIAKALPLVVARAQAVRAIPPPDELAPLVRRMLSFSDTAIGQLRLALKEASAGKILEPSQALGRFLVLGEEAHKLALRIGLSC